MSNAWAKFVCSRAETRVPRLFILASDLLHSKTDKLKRWNEIISAASPNAVLKFNKKTRRKEISVCGV